MPIQSRFTSLYHRLTGHSEKRAAAPLGRKIGIVALAGLLAVGSLAPLDADARRMGGGRTIGKQSQITRQPSAPTQPAPGTAPQADQAARTQTPQTPPPAPAQPRRSWLGPLAGIAAGLGIAALLSHFGLGGALASMLGNVILVALIAFVGLWLFRMFTRRRNQGTASNSTSRFEPQTSPPLRQYDAPAPSSAGLGNTSSTAGAAAGALAGGAAGGAASANAPSVPAGFDTEAFLRQAKVSFVRLQAAWDAGNLDDIREFTTPEMFAEVKLDLNARGAEPNRTDVVQLDAELLGAEDRGDEHVASVRFHGLLRETVGAAAEPFDETWNLSRNVRRGEGWLLAGIQQMR